MDLFQQHYNINFFLYIIIVHVINIIIGLQKIL